MQQLESLPCSVLPSPLALAKHPHGLCCGGPTNQGDSCLQQIEGGQPVYRPACDPGHANGNVCITISPMIYQIKELLLSDGCRQGQRGRCADGAGQPVECGVVPWHWRVQDRLAAGCTPAAHRWWWKRPGATLPPLACPSTSFMPMRLLRSGVSWGQA